MLIDVRQIPAGLHDDNWLKSRCGAGTAPRDADGLYRQAHMHVASRQVEVDTSNDGVDVNGTARFVTSLPLRHVSVHQPHASRTCLLPQLLPAPG